MSIVILEKKLYELELCSDLISILAQKIEENEDSSPMSVYG